MVKWFLFYFILKKLFTMWFCRKYLVFSTWWSLLLGLELFPNYGKMVDCLPTSVTITSEWSTGTDRLVGPVVDMWVWGIYWDPDENKRLLSKLLSSHKAVPQWGSLVPAHCRGCFHYFGANVSSLTWAPKVKRQK